MKRLLFVFLFISLVYSGLSQTEKDEVELILPHPYLMMFDYAFLSSDYVLISRRTDEYIVYGIYDINTRNLLASDIVGFTEEEGYDFILNIREEYFLNKEIEYYFSDYSLPEIYNMDNYLELADRENLLIKYHESDTITVFSDDNKYEHKFFAKDIISEDSELFSISPDRKQIAVLNKKHIEIYSTSDGKLLWISEKMASAYYEEFVLLNNNVIVLPSFSKKHKNYHVYWYDFKNDKVKFSTEKYLMNSFVGEYQAYYYLIMSYGQPESKKISSSSFINLKTGEFGNRIPVKSTQRYTLAHYITDSIITKEISEEEHDEYFQNYTMYSSWNDLLNYYYEIDEYTGSIKIRVKSPMTVDPSFFTDNEYEDSIFRYDYEIISAFKNKVTYKDISQDIKFGEFGSSKIKKELLFWNGDIDNPSLRKIKLVVSSGGVPIFLAPDNYYMSTKDAKNILAFKVNNKRYGFEQFDLKFNRPDIILERLGYADQNLIDAYRNAYLKRLKKMGFREVDLGSDLHIPNSKILNLESLNTFTDKSHIGLDLEFFDEKFKLDRYNIWINDVPLFGVRGKNLKDKQSHNFSVSESLKLNQGKNKIQVSCMNVKGAESFKETIEIIYEPLKQTKPDLYVISIGVSEYDNSSYDLEFADKDADNVADLFLQNKKNFENIHVTKLLNKEATKENILKLKEQLQNTNVDDQVIVFFAGHGMLDGFDYYLGTAETDAENLSETALPYEDFESLLDGIPARQKLLLLDACHSGEVDSEDVVPKDDMLFSDKRGIVKYIGKTRNALENKSKLSYNNSFQLMKQLFADLRRGTGSMVISSAGGGEFAIEGEMMKDGKIVKVPNGIFTYSLIEALRNKKADTNNDSNITISELKTYVFENVSRLSAGYQNPTSRMENLELDFVVW